MRNPSTRIAIANRITRVPDDDSGRGSRRAPGASARPSVSIPVGNLFNPNSFPSRSAGGGREESGDRASELRSYGVMSFRSSRLRSRGASGPKGPLLARPRGSSLSGRRVGGVPRGALVSTLAGGVWRLRPPGLSLSTALHRHAAGGTIRRRRPSPELSARLAPPRSPKSARHAPEQGPGRSLRSRSVKGDDLRSFSRSSSRTITEGEDARVDVGRADHGRRRCGRGNSSGRVSMGRDAGRARALPP